MSVASEIIAELTNSIDSLSEELLVEKLDDFFRASGISSQKILLNGLNYQLLNFFCKKGKANLTNLLLIRNPDRNSLDDEGRTPLQQVTAKSNNLPESVVLRIVKDLLRSGADVDATSSKQQRPLLNAIDRGSAVVVAELVRYKPSFKKFQAPFGSALWVASYRGLANIVKLLVDGGADPNDVGLGETVATTDAMNNFAEYIDCGYSTYYSEYPRTSSLSYLFVQRQRVDLVTPLMISSYLGHVEVVRSLLAAKATFTQADASGNTAIHHACAGGHWNVLALLLAIAGADKVEELNSHGETPLRVALMNRRFLVIENLIKAGATVGELEFLISIQQNDEVSLRHLLLFGKSNEAREKKGKFSHPSINVLKAAVRSGNRGIIMILIREGEYDKNVIEDYVAQEVDDATMKDVILDTLTQRASIKQEVREEDAETESGKRRQRGK